MCFRNREAPVIDHIQITVKDMRVALPFQDKLMALLGFDLENRTNAVVQSHEFHVVECVTLPLCSVLLLEHDLPALDRRDDVQQ